MMDSLSFTKTIQCSGVGLITFFLLILTIVIFIGQATIPTKTYAFVASVEYHPTYTTQQIFHLDLNRLLIAPISTSFDTVNYSWSQHSTIYREPDAGQTYQIIDMQTGEWRDFNFEFNSRSHSWSPDGRYLAEYNYDEETEQIEFVIHDTVENHPPKRLEVLNMNSGNCCNLGDTLSWSANGQYLSMERIDGSGTDEPALLNIIIIEIETGNVQQIPLDISYNAPQLSYQISPDGSQIAFTASTSPETQSNNELYIVPVDGSESPTRLIHAGVFDHIAPISWSPNSQYLAFDMPFNDQSDRTGIYIVDATTYEIIELTTIIREGVHLINWSPDSQWLSTTGYIDIELAHRVIHIEDGTNRGVIMQGANNTPIASRHFWIEDTNQIMFLASDGQIHIENANGSNRYILRYSR